MEDAGERRVRLPSLADAVVETEGAVPKARERVPRGQAAFPQRLQQLREPAHVTLTRKALVLTKIHELGA